MVITEQWDAKKQKIDEGQAWERLSSVPKIFISQGKKTLEFAPDASSKEEVLKKAMGRSGNLRAPTMLIDNVYYVGFNVELYAELFA